MSIAVRCPACRSAFAIADQYAGKKGRCPKCRAVFVAPVKKTGPKPFWATTTRQKSSTRRAPSAITPPPLSTAGAKSTSDESVDTLGELGLDLGDNLLDSSTDNRNAAEGKEKETRPSRPQATSAARTLAPSPRRAPLGLWVGAVAALVLVFLAVGVLVWSFFPPANAKKNADTSDVAHQAASESPSNPEGEPFGVSLDQPPTPLSVPEPPFPDRDTPNPIPQKYAGSLKYVVTLEISTPAGLRQGTGFLLDTRGWVAANLHLTRQATKVHVKFPHTDKAQAKIPAEGVLADSPQHDLVLIQLGPPGSPVYTDPPLAAGQSLAPESPAMLLTGSEASQCRIRRVLTADQLPAPVRAAARQRGLTDRAEFTWIEFTQSIRQSQCGSPLLDATGKIVGIATWLGDSLSFGYAVHAKHLVELTASAGDEVRAFGSSQRVENMLSGGRLSTDAVEASKMGDSPLGDAPFRSGPAGAKPKEGGMPDLFATFHVTAEAIYKLRDECKANGWTAKNLVEYRPLQNLAYAVTMALENAENNTAATLPPEQRSRWKAAGRAAEEVLEELRNVPWPAGPDGMREMGRFDELAAKALARDEGPLFAYVRVETPADQIANNVKEPVVIMELVGANELIVAPVSKNIGQLTFDSHWLMLGIMRTRGKVTTRDGDKRDAAGIFCKTLIGKPEE